MTLYYNKKMSLESVSGYLVSSLRKTFIDRIDKAHTFKQQKKANGLTTYWQHW